MTRNKIQWQDFVLQLSELEHERVSATCALVLPLIVC